MRKRITAWLLSVCMAVSLLAVPAGAAGSATVTFSDIGDRTTAMAVESLRLMGVLDGYGDGTFRPGTVLTRAQFCKMAVYALNGSDELGRYRTVTVFPDVKPSHWAAAYINMAAKGKSIIAGYADGQFHPDRTVTVGQAVTILLRMLGYKDEDVGGVWPDSYMAEGAVIGLTDGVGTDGNAGLTRGQAARLFLNLLNSPTKEGGSTFAGTIGQTVEGVLVSADNEGGTGRLKLSTGAAYSLTEGRASNGMLNGMRGTLIVDSGSGRALTFVPEITGSSRTVVLAAAKPEELTDTAGNTYAVSGDTQVFQNGAVSAWSEAYAWLSAGTSLTLYLDAAGSVDYVFAGGGSTSTAAVIVYEDRSTAGFESLTGGAADYAIYKNGVRANAGDMRRYDVATYSPMDNAIRVCDTRIAGYYEDCSPNPEAPSTITVLGHEFNVLPSARQSVSQFRPGDQMTLLLTEDNQVAGAVKAGTGAGGAAGNAMGIAQVSGSSAKVNLLCGITVEGSFTGSAEQMDGQLVRVSSTKRGQISLTRLTGGVSGDLDLETGKLGSRDLAENLIVFQDSGDGLTAISLSQITDAVVPRNRITYAATDWDGRVRIIVLNASIAASGYTFGRAEYTATYDEEGNRVGNARLAVQYGESQKTAAYETGYVVRNGDVVGISIVNDGSSQRIGRLIYPEELRNIPNEAWSGPGAVTVNGRTYTVPSNVPCYNLETDNWVTLTEARQYADTCTLYIHENMVRFIEVG